ncbi:hypothetical protein PMIN01_07732, partial [Paraphaeosphaeria minitans]
GRTGQAIDDSLSGEQTSASHHKPPSVLRCSAPLQRVLLVAGCMCLDSPEEPALLFPHRPSNGKIVQPRGARDGQREHQRCRGARPSDLAFPERPRPRPPGLAFPERPPGLAFPERPPGLAFPFRGYNQNNHLTSPSQDDHHHDSPPPSSTAAPPTSNFQAPRSWNKARRSITLVPIRMPRCTRDSKRYGTARCACARRQLIDIAREGEDAWSPTLNKTVPPLKTEKLRVTKRLVQKSGHFPTPSRPRDEKDEG